jgi:hypothetical protein
VRYSVAPRKGGRPAIIWNKMQPYAQISDLAIMLGKSIQLNWYHYSRYYRTYCILACSFRSTSGDTYSAVPTKDRFLPSAVRYTSGCQLRETISQFVHIVQTFGQLDRLKSDRVNHFGATKICDLDPPVVIKQDATQLYKP